MEKTFGNRAGNLMSWCVPVPLGVSKGNGNTRSKAEGLCWCPLDLTIAFKGPWDYRVCWDRPELVGMSLGGEGHWGRAVPSVPGPSQLCHVQTLEDSLLSSGSVLSQGDSAPSMAALPGTCPAQARLLAKLSCLLCLVPAVCCPLYLLWAGSRRQQDSTP